MVPFRNECSKGFIHSRGVGRFNLFKDTEGLGHEVIVQVMFRWCVLFLSGGGDYLQVAPGYDHRQSAFDVQFWG